MQITDTASSSRHFIPTLLERKGDVIYAFAYCPTCDKVEKSEDKGCGQQYALDISIAKIRTHIRLYHRIS